MNDAGQGFLNRGARQGALGHGGRRDAARTRQEAVWATRTIAFELPPAKRRQYLLSGAF